MELLDVDAVIIGAGPAGAVAALNLAPYRRVLLVDRHFAPTTRIGESLPGAARRLLNDMGLWDGFLADGHQPRHVHRSIWGGADVVERDALCDPDGHGWHLDRERFERRLRATAVSRGARLLAPVRRISLARASRGWRLDLDHDGQRVEARARILVDAGGRSSRLSTGLGATRRADDKTVCAWLRADSAALPVGVTLVEAEADGWWYAAGTPGGGGVLAFHTDADLAASKSVRSAEGMLDRVRSLPMLSGRLDLARWRTAQTGYCAAHGASLAPFAGSDWIALGDAALAFDPLAAQGLFNALYTGLAAAEAVHHALDDAPNAFIDYAAEMGRIRRAYLDHRQAWYGLETRWSSNPFWRRRLR